MVWVDMAYHIRKASIQDAQNLAALAIQVFLHTYATSGIRSALSGFVLNEFTPGKLRALLEDPAHILLVAEAEDHLLAFADLNLQSPRAEIPGITVELATLYVQEHFAGMGIGSALLREGAELAKLATGRPELWLSVYHRNDRALAFYRKHGLQERGSFAFEFGGESHENVLLAWTGTRRG